MAGIPSTTLVLTNSKDATADYLCDSLESRGLSALRLDTDDLISRVLVGYSVGSPTLIHSGRRYAPGDFASVWNRRPERLKHAPLEATPEGEFVLDEWSEALEGFLAHVAFERWVNHPSSNARASHKLQQLTLARSLGFDVPETLVTQDPGALRDFHRAHAGRVVAKPMARGYVGRPDGELASQIYTNLVLEEHLSDLSDLPAAPTLFQRYIEKSFDVRLTVVDDRMHAVELRAGDGTAQRCDIRRNNMADVRYRATSLPGDLAGRVARLMGHYRLRFAAIDFAVAEDGRWHFLEINPNGQWAWMDIEGATDIASSLVRSLAP